MNKEEAIVFDAWFSKLSIEEQREYVEDMEADYALMLQDSLDY